MSPVLIVVTDRAKARFFTLETPDLTDYKVSPRLVENEVLVNPEQELADRQLWANPKSQAGHYQEGKGTAHSYDDRRQNHDIEFQRRFAKDLAAQVLNQAQVQEARRLVLIAEPQFLGLLREVLTPALPKSLALEELDKNLCNLTPQQLYEYLAGRNYLPSPQKAGGIS
jgi:protein required for attachment to host cells